MLDGQGDEISGHENLAFIPEHRTGPAIGQIRSSFLWFPAARALAWLWAPSHRCVTDHSGDIQLPGAPNLHSQEPSHIVFIIGSAGSGKRELLAETYRLLPAGEESDPLEGWMPPVDIIILPDTDGLSLRLLWTPGSFGQLFTNPPCNNTVLGTTMFAGYSHAWDKSRECQRRCREGAALQERHKRRPLGPEMPPLL
jgi:hypothetical protein